MALQEELPDAGREMRPVMECLRQCSDFAAVDDATLQRLADGAARFSLPAGCCLFEPASRPEGVYLLVSGRLAVRYTGGTPSVDVIRGDLVGEAAWLLKVPHAARAVALRDSELLLLPGDLLDSLMAAGPQLAIAMARLSARRLEGGPAARPQARIFVLMPNSEEIDIAELATSLIGALGRLGTAELVWDVRASSQSLAWFQEIAERNEFVVYVAGPADSGWTRQCCRQADVILLAAPARGEVRPWIPGLAAMASPHGTRLELALVHDGGFAAGAARRWLAALPVAAHHHIVDASDLDSVARLLARRGVGLVLSGGGARGFAHLGVIRAMRDARIPIDFVGGVSIGSIIAAGVAMGWDDEEMLLRYRRCFVATNPVNDYTIPMVALTRGRKVSRLLQHEFGDTAIEDLRRPFFCLSANLTTGTAVEHGDGPLVEALRASVAIPGVMPPVMHSAGILVDGAAINNLPVDVMQCHAPGVVIGCDVGADRAQRHRGKIHIFQILMYAGLVNSAASARAERLRADVLLAPPLENIDLLNWHAFDRAIQAGYTYARAALAGAPQLPRISADTAGAPRLSSLALELERRRTVKSRVRPPARPPSAG